MFFQTISRWLMLAATVLLGLQLVGCAVTYTQAPLHGRPIMESASDWRKTSSTTWTTVRDGWIYRAEYRLGQLELNKSRLCSLYDRRHRWNRDSSETIEYRNWQPSDSTATGLDCLGNGISLPIIVVEGPAFWTGLPREVRELYADTARLREDRRRRSERRF